MMRLIFAIVFPILVMASWASYHAFINVQGSSVELAVVGYDPRDLLSGHYLNYQVDYGAPVCQKANVKEHCVCLTAPAAGNAKAKWNGSCDARPEACASWLRGSCKSGRFVAGIERFYFAEEHQDALTVTPPQASIRVRLNNWGGGQVEDLLVDGHPLEEWLTAQEAQTPQP